MQSYLFDNKSKNWFVIITAALNFVLCFYNFVNEQILGGVINFDIGFICSLLLTLSFGMIIVGVILADSKFYNATKIILPIAFALQISPIVYNIVVLEIPRFLIYTSLGKWDVYLSYIIGSTITTLLQIGGLILLIIGFIKTQKNAVILKIGSICLIALYLYALVTELIKLTPGMNIYSLPSIIYSVRYLIFYISILLLTFNKEQTVPTIDNLTEENSKINE